MDNLPEGYIWEVVNLLCEVGGTDEVQSSAASSITPVVEQSTRPLRETKYDSLQAFVQLCEALSVKCSGLVPRKRIAPPRLLYTLVPVSS